MYVRPEGPVLRGVPGVHLLAFGVEVATCDTVGLDQRAVQDQVVQALLPALGEDSMQVRGLLGEDVDTLVQVAVAGGLRDTRVAGQAVHATSVAEPTQDHDRLPKRAQGTRSPRCTDPAAVSAEQLRQHLHDMARNVEHGNIGDQREAPGEQAVL